MQLEPGRFKGLLRRACGLELQRVAILAALDGLHRGLLAASGPTSVEAATTVAVHPEMCIPCRRAFVSRKAWAGHAARLHGYRSKAFLLGDTPVCRGCGRSYGSVGRLRRHLTVVPKCAASWGSFTPATGPAHEIHPLAPPFEVPGTWRAFDVGADDNISHGLLTDLRSLSDCAEDEVWSAIEDHVEPLSSLRATVQAWKAEYPDSHWHQEVAENMLFLLDPQVSAEHFPREAPPAG